MIVVAFAMLGQRLTREEAREEPSISLPFSVLMGCSILSSVAAAMNPVLFAEVFGWA